MKEPTKAHILVVDDENEMRELLIDLFSNSGFKVTAVASGLDMRQVLLRQAISLVILDLRLQDEDGLILARELRRESAIPILMLSGKGDQTDRIVGLELVADDFVMKPFNNRELLARVRALLRRTIVGNHHTNDNACRHERYRFGPWIIDFTSRVVCNDQHQTISLTQAEFSLLETLVRSPNHVFTRDQLLEKTRGIDADIFDRTIDVIILRLRRKIEFNPKNPTWIRTERGMGYSLSAQVVRC